MSGPSYAQVYRLACREALAIEMRRSADWRSAQARLERSAIARGELQARDAIWNRGER